MAAKSKNKYVYANNINPEQKAFHFPFLRNISFLPVVVYSFAFFASIFLWASGEAFAKKGWNEWCETNEKQKLKEWKSIYPAQNNFKLIWMDVEPERKNTRKVDALRSVILFFFLFRL